MYTVITGASSGIGKQLAFIYAKNGHNLILVSRRIEVLKQLKSEIQGLYNVLIECYVCDLSNLEEVEVFSHNINEKFLINCLINNAGIGLFEKVEDITLNSLIVQNNINVVTPILITKNLLLNIIKNNGSVINICSVLSFIPNLKSSVYVANKHALFGFSNNLRLEYPKLHVLSVHPATVRTSFFNDENYFNNVKKVLTPEIVAQKTYKAHKNKKRKLYIPSSIRLLNILYQLFSKKIDSINRKFFSNK